MHSVIEDFKHMLCWYISVIPTLKRLRQEDLEFKVSLGYVARSCLKKTKTSQALVAHSYNPSYSGDRDQEDCGLKPARANSSRDPISKSPSQK
jgi:hypothetical protein